VRLTIIAEGAARSRLLKRETGTPRALFSSQRILRGVAAGLVCGSPDTRELQLLAEYRSCVNDAVNGALAQIELPKS
jgi:hypothetical protein